MEKKQVEIDVVVPVYNVEDFIADCLSSLIYQTIPVNIIVVDDGSPDNSVAIIEKFIEQFPDRIRLVSQENQGLSAARNTGLSFVESPYCAFMDSDDWVSPDYYEAMLQTIQRADADICCSDITYTYVPKQHVKRSNTIHSQQNHSLITNAMEEFPTYIIDIFPMVQNKLWRTELIKSNGLQFMSGRLYEDLDFFYRIYPFLERIAFTESGIFYYRQRRGSIVKNANPKIYDITAIFEHIIQGLKDTGNYDTYQELIEYLLIRNCLVASSKRLAYARNFRFIYTYLNKLYNFVRETVPNWRKNRYIKSFTIRHLYLKSIYSFTIPFYAFILKVIGLFLQNTDDF